MEVKVLNKHESKFSLVAGVNMTNYNFKGREFSYLTRMQFNWQTNLMAGLAFQLLLPRNRHKWSIYNELAWKRNYTQGKFDEKDLFYEGNGIITIKANYIGLTSMVRYSWVNQNWQPFINAGLAANMALSISTRIQGQEKYKTSEQITDKNILENPGMFEGAIVAGGGIKVNKMAAEIRLEQGNGYVNPYVEISSRKTMLIFLLSYSFN